MTDAYSGRALSCVWFIDANTEPGIEGAAVDILRSHVPVWAKDQDATTLDPD